MKAQRSILISALAIVMVMGITLSSSRALEFSDWVGTWHKIKVTFKIVCEESLTEELFKASAKDNAWIYIQSYNDADGEYVAYLVTLEEDGEWAAEQITLSTIEDSEPGTSPLGTPDDVILESNDIEVEDSDTGDIVQVYFIVRVTGKEKQGELKEGKLKGVVGMATFIFPGIGECVGSVIISGKLKKEEKVPEEVIAAKDAA